MSVDDNYIFTTSLPGSCYCLCILFCLAGSQHGASEAVYYGDEQKEHTATN